MALDNGYRIAARSGDLILSVRTLFGVTRWNMSGGQFGPHSLREPTYNDRVSADWTNYCIINGHRAPSGDEIPSVTR